MYFDSLLPIIHAGFKVSQDQKLTRRDRSMIQALARTGFKRAEVARMYQVDPSCVRQIELGTWVRGHNGPKTSPVTFG